MPSPPRRARRRAGALGALAALAAAPAPALAEAVFSFQGRGFGHGVGMSQHGARGAALQGWDAQRILAHYYRGAEVTASPGAALRVRVVEGASAVSVRGDAPLAVAFAGGPGPSLPAGVPHRVVRAGAGLSVRDARGAEVARGPAPLALRPAVAAALRLEGRRYRGHGEVHAVPGGLDAVNVVELEDYLAGVLPREMPASWGEDAPAALDAQAIAARSYALATRRRAGHYDLHADVRSQVYGGRDGEDPRTSAAVARTRGRVLTHGGAVVAAYFFSSSGGRTEDVEKVWGGAALPYLRSVPDPFDAVSPYHRAWPDPPAFTARELGRRLGTAAPVARVEVLQRGSSPRVLRVRVVDARGAAREMAGTEVRTALGLRSTWFAVARRGVAAGTAPVRLTARQLLINQRISQAAVRRVNRAWAVHRGVPAPRAVAAGRPGAVRLTVAQLRIGQRISQAAVRRANALHAALQGRPAPSAAPAGSPGRLRLTARQLLINQRIAQAAVRRANALLRAVSAGELSRPRTS